MEPKQLDSMAPAVGIVQAPSAALPELRARLDLLARMALRHVAVAGGWVGLVRT